jgi:glutaryl-CoA dehydrogenase
MQSRKRRGKDWVINGAKMWITNAPIADLAIVWTMTEDGVRGFIVEKESKGYAATEIERKFSLRASVTGALFFADVLVPEENMLPGSTVGLKAPLSCLTQARYGIAGGGNIVCIISGGNIDAAKLGAILNGEIPF